MNKEEEKGLMDFDLSNFSLSDMTECGRAIRELGNDAKSMEEAANRITQYLYEHLVDKQSGEKACVLVRLFKTHPYANLNKVLQEYAQHMLSDHAIKSGMKCFVLLGTIGARQEWASRNSSAGHQAIPLPSEEVVKQIPMMRNLIKQMGLEINSVINPDEGLLLDMAQKHFNVFYVPDALGSPYIPAQENFVIPYKVKTVLGMGGALPSGDVFSVIMFTRVYIKREVADLFKTMALNIKMALLPFESSVFS